MESKEFDISHLGECTHSGECRALRKVPELKSDQKLEEETQLCLRTPKDLSNQRGQQCGHRFGAISRVLVTRGYYCLLLFTLCFFTISYPVLFKIQKEWIIRWMLFSGAICSPDVELQRGLGLGLGFCRVLSTDSLSLL